MRVERAENKEVPINALTGGDAFTYQGKLWVKAMTPSEGPQRKAFSPETGESKLFAITLDVYPEPDAKVVVP